MFGWLKRKQPVTTEHVESELSRSMFMYHKLQLRLIERLPKPLKHTDAFRADFTVKVTNQLIDDVCDADHPDYRKLVTLVDMYTYRDLIDKIGESRDAFQAILSNHGSTSATLAGD